MCVCVFFLLSQILLFCLAAEKQNMSAKINDLALQATTVMARSLRQVMSTMVVLELHLWLNLSEMCDADKVCLLDAPIF